jgi:superfamily II DNA or RNA helicase
VKRSDLHPYQQNLIATAKSIPNLGLFLPPGLGKTITTLTIIAEQMQGKTLIIAPKRVAETVWDAEVNKWDHLKHLTVSKILGNPTQRSTALSQKSDIYIVNLENVDWLFQQNAKFDNLIIDESSRFKDPSTKCL